MNNDTTTLTCPACLEQTDSLTKRSWTHYNHDSAWAHDDGEYVKGEYCFYCISDIKRIETAQAEVENSEEPTLENWAELACRLAMGINRAFSNWKDVANVTQREMKMLANWMGDDWQRKWH